MGRNIQVYGAKTCSDTRRSRQFLEAHDVAYSWIDVDDDAEGLERIKSVNNGNRATPTIFLQDGSILIEPSDDELAEKLGIQPNA